MTHATPHTDFMSLDALLPRSAAPVAANLAQQRSVARSLLNAWDRAMSGWRASPTTGLAREALSTSGFDHAYFAASDLPPLRPLGPYAAAVQPGARGVSRHDEPAVDTGNAGLSAQLLGELVLWVDGRAVHELPEGKARSLLKLLLLQRSRPVSRKRLCSLLWPELAEAAARTELNVALHKVRRTLGKVNLLRASDEGYQLVVTGEVWLDTEQFLLNADMGRAEQQAGFTSAAIAHLEAAAAMYRADLIEEDGAAGDTALLAENHALRDRLCEVLERLGTLRESVGDLHGALRTAVRHQALDECNERVYQRLMRCYAGLGQPRLAERQFRACAAALRAGRGVFPSEASAALCRRLTGRQPLHAV